MRAFSLALLLFLTGCGGVTYRHAAEPGFSFNEARTFLVEHPNVFSPHGVSRLIQRNPFFVSRTRNALTRELSALGLREAAANPSLLFSFRTELTWKNAVDPAEFRLQEGTAGSHFPDSDPRGRTYGERTLIIEARDPLSQKIVWTGRAERLSPNFYELEETLVKVVRKILEDFPH